MSLATPLEGAVRGRMTYARSCKPLLPASLLGWIVGSFRRCRCSHCFAVVYLPPGAENVLMVVGVVMLTIARGTAREDVVN
jgi:hypothetical protein